MIPQAVPVPPRAELPRWGGSDAKIAVELVEIRERLGRIELALLTLTEQRAEAEPALPVDREWYDATEAGEVLNVSARRVGELCLAGKLIGVKRRGIGKAAKGSWSVSREELDRFRREGFHPSYKP